MLTINADTHPLMQLFHRQTDEKRMVVILSDDQYNDWLSLGVEDSREFFREYSAELLTAEAKQGKVLAKWLFVSGTDAQNKSKKATKDIISL